MESKYLSVKGTEWRATGLTSPDSLSWLTVVPSVNTSKVYRRRIPAYENHDGPNGYNSHVWVEKGDTVTVWALNPYDTWADFQDDCTWHQRYANGARYYDDETTLATSQHRLPLAPIGSLVGRVGNGPWHFIGTDNVFIAENSGWLVLGRNDSKEVSTGLGDTFEDNSGNILVGIVVGPVIQVQAGDGSPIFIGRYGYDGPSGGEGEIKVRVTSGAEKTFSAWFIVDALHAPITEGDVGCLGHCGAGENESGNPVSLRDGEKRLEATDLSLNTPAGPLNFERRYRQYRQEDSAFALMGLGWKHNHHIALTLSGSTPEREAVVLSAEGGRITLQENSMGQFEALSGSTATMDYQADYFGVDQHAYVLNSPDKTTYAFDATTNELKERRWPDGEVWTYTYDLSGNLTEIDDGYGRQLLFSYYTGGFKDGQLWRVGDQTAAGLDSGSPSGCYVEYDYVQEALGGVPLNSGRALLVEVTDSRGQIWSYTYYGAASSETDGRLMNYLIKVGSPAVDTTGDGINDGQIIRNRLSYSFTQELVDSGDMEAEGGWYITEPGAESINELSIAQVYTGTYSRHVKLFDGESLEGESFSLISGRIYTVRASVYMVNGQVDMAIGESGNFDASTSGLGVWETLEVIHRVANDESDVVLQFSPNGTDAEFYLDAVSIQEERGLLVNGSMEIDDAWQDIAGATPTVNERSSAQADSGLYARHVICDAADEGIESELFDLDADMTYILTARAYVASGVLQMSVDGTVAFDTLSTGTGAWETLRVIYTPNASLEEARLQFTASGSAAEFYIDSVSLMPVEPDIASIQQERGIWFPNVGEPEEALETTTFVFRPEGHNLTSEETADKMTIHYFANGVYLGTANPAGEIAPQILGEDYRPQVQGDGEGNSTNLTWSEGGQLLNGVTDALGGQTTFTYDAEDRLHRSRDPQGRETVYIYNDADAPRKPSHVLVVKGRELIRNGGMEEDSHWMSISGAAPLTNEQSDLYIADGRYSRHVECDTADEGIESEPFTLQSNHTYTVRASVYVVNGLVKMQVADTAGAFDATTATTGGWETLEVVYRPTSDVSETTLQFVASGGVAEFYVDAVTLVEDHNQIINGRMEQDVGWTSAGTPTINAHSNVEVDTGSYAWHVVCDAAGEGLRSSPLDIEASTTYALLARVYPVSGTIKMGFGNTSRFDVSTVGTGEWETLFVYDIQPDALSGEALQFLSSSGAAEFYVDSVLMLTQDQILSWRAFDYDDHGRTLVEQTLDPTAPLGAALQETARSYYPAGSGAGLLQSVTEKDLGGTEDKTTTYFYDSVGRVVQTNQNSTFGSCTRSYTVYDAQGNVVASICNYENAGASPSTASEAAALYNPAHPEQNRVTTHDYDALGRRVKSTSMAGASEAQTTATVYDALDRVTRTIRNLDVSVDNEYGLWVWDEIDERWEDAVGNAVDHGTGNIRNLVNDSLYNQRGMVRMARSSDGQVTLSGYDDAGRVVKTVKNASQSNYDNDYTSTGDPWLAEYVPTDEPDEDIVSSQVYNANGRVVKQVNPLGQVTFTEYDALNRVVATLQAASMPDYNILSDDGYTVSDALDADIISGTIYDSVGRSVLQIDAADNIILTGYDELGRQVKTIRSASNPGYDIVADPDLSEYLVSSEADYDLVQITEYDAQGRVARSQDVSGIWTAYGYDGLGRQVSVVQNHVENGEDVKAWVWDEVDGRYELDDGTLIEHGVNNDQNLVSQTVYDADGRVKFTRNAQGLVTLNGYDSLNRQVAVIQNASQPDYDTVLDPGLDSYVPSGLPDEDRITRTVYDEQGRVSRSIDPLGNETRYQYDELGRRVATIQNYISGVFDPDHPDEDRISQTTYDLAGRVLEQVNPAGVVTHFLYDGMGRQTATIQNYVNGVFDSEIPDEDVISHTEYNKAGQVVATVDARGTRTMFGYDNAGRRSTITRAAGTGQAVTDLTVYDKAGRTLRTIRNWLNQLDAPAPNEMNENGEWKFAPVTHGHFRDQNLVTDFELDAVGRVVAVTNPLGLTTTTIYDKAGRVLAEADPEGRETLYAYDALGRRIQTIQNYVDGVADSLVPDEDVTVTVSYDLGGRMVSRLDPMQQETAYNYDALGRRTALTLLPGDEDLERIWTTAYSESTGSRVETLTDPMGGQTVRGYDRLGRLADLEYVGSVTGLQDTPTVLFGYDAYGNRSLMTEYDGASPVRETGYGYDALGHLTEVRFDEDGDGTIEQIVSYQYDAGGLRTQMSLPGGLTVTYEYDAQGRLMRLSDWDEHSTRYTYDGAGRLTGALRGNGLNSRYEHNAGGQLKRLTHRRTGKVLGHFEYIYDPRGNRIQAVEALPQPMGQTLILPDDDTIEYLYGDWVDGVSTTRGARLRLAVFGKRVTFTFGTGPDHGMVTVRLNGAFWKHIDGYAATSDQREVVLEMEGDGPHQLEFECWEKNLASSGYVMELQQVATNRAYDLHTISYQYDGISRLTAADYHPGFNTGATVRQYGYAYDLAGNRTQKLVDGVTTDYTYNALNQLITANDGTTETVYGYDANGNLTTTGVETTHTWDRANRLVSHDGSEYAYNGAGQRVSQTVDDVVTSYLLDVQPELWTVIGAISAGGTVHYLHGPMGIERQQQPDDTWVYPVVDALGSVRGVVDEGLSPLESRQYAPYGEVFASAGTQQTAYGFTGEPSDANGLVHLRARYYGPEVGRFTSMDPSWLEENLYSYAASHPVKFVDPSGLCPSEPQPLDLLGQRCVWLAEKLSDDYSLSLEVLMEMSVVELEYINTLGTMSQALNDIAILPNLFREDPKTALEALWLYASGCNTENTALVGSVGVGSLSKTPVGALVAGSIALILSVFAAIGVVEREIDIPFPNPTLKRRWCCNAQCNIQAIRRDANCPNRTEGYSVGANEAEACREAKRVATQACPPGCYPRHCKCNCSQC